ncbi:DUF6644 family protein [Niveispirillum sp. KHB5.9]|uniref:DUF6644 family protein n=1 Tax=Niveispirillum sp. KHB5.9 TaxID=3400269 RepID=UPI003A84C961
MSDILHSIETSPVAQFMRENAAALPWTATLHVIAITLVLGTIAIVDLRLVGYPAHRRSARQLMREMLPFTWGAFALALATGLLLFAAHATDYVGKGPFKGKMLLLALAGINMAVFHVTAYRRIGDWDHALRPPFGVRIAGGLSLLLWVGVTFAGRWIGFV